MWCYFLPPDLQWKKRKEISSADLNKFLPNLDSMYVQCLNPLHLLRLVKLFENFTLWESSTKLSLIIFNKVGKYRGGHLRLFLFTESLRIIQGPRPTLVHSSYQLFKFLMRFRSGDWNGHARSLILWSVTSTNGNSLYYFFKLWRPLYTGLWTPDHVIHMLLNNPFQIQFFLFCYNTLHCSRKAFH